MLTKGENEIVLSQNECKSYFS